MLVPNQRVRDRCLADAFDDVGDAGVRVAPPVAVLSQWVSDTAARLDLLAGVPVPASAGPLALQLAWYEAVGPHGSVTNDAQRRAVARRARAADRELRHWFPEPGPAWLDPAFRSWRNAVEAQLERRHLATPEHWILRLAARLESDANHPALLPRRVQLGGFVELTALERRLFDALAARGVAVAADVDSPPPRAPGGTILTRAFDDPQAELRAAAHWARDRFRDGCRRIGIIVNELDGLAAEVRPAFDRILAGGPGHARLRDDVPGWHLPGGATLAAQPAVAEALLLLRVSLGGPGRPLPFPRLSHLLLSPFIAGAVEERHDRAAFERDLREDERYRRTPRELAARLRRRSGAPRLRVLGALLGDLPAVGRASDLAAAFLDCLAAWGWPGALPGTAAAAASVARFAALLEELRPGAGGTGHDALGWLEQAARQTPVTERGGPLSPIQVLAPQDAVGARFDAAWVANVHADNWPGRALVNPFLPAEAGRHIPRATPAGERAYAQRLHAHLAALAPDVVFSWARQGGDAKRLPSPLLPAGANEVGTVQPASARAGPWPDADAGPACGDAEHPWLQVVKDAPGLPLPDSAPIPGGADMVRYQSACPLAAYLRHRLAARFEPMPGPFADAAYRGVLLHAALESLFREQVGMPGLPAPGAVPGSVDRALAGAAAAQRLGAAACAAERERLIRVLGDWLQFESGRHGFTVHAVERRCAFDHRGHALAARIDRIDRLADGRLLLLDYKSSAVDAVDWADARPAQPQLPLYAVLLERAGEARVGGLALAAVRPGDCGFSGVVDDSAAAHGKLYDIGQASSGLAGRFPDWAALRGHFERCVTGLLDEIVAGAAGNLELRPDVIAWAGLEPVLRHAEGRDWLTAYGVGLPDEAND